MSEDPDKKLGVSDSRRMNLREDMKKALNPDNTLYELNLGFKMTFNRKYPPGSSHTATMDQLKSLNTSLIHDC